jgi:hypothetical protein
MDIVPYFKALADPRRIKILATIVDKPRSMEEIVQEAGLSARVVAGHLAYLRSLDLVTEHDDPTGARFRFNQKPLFAAMKSLSPKSEAPEMEGDAFDRKVMSDFFEGGRLKAIPMPHKKRDVILRFLAQQFEPGRMYEEKEVNEVLRPYHDDYASLRRYLVDGGFLTRQIIREVEVEALMAGNPRVDLRVRYWKEAGSL